MPMCQSTNIGTEADNVLALSGRADRADACLLSGVECVAKLGQ